ncbi:Uncharacterised protein [Klebsiella pneumoniae]|nr:Uncharacterised protein [Klebsiella pneumoniae]
MSSTCSGAMDESEYIITSQVLVNNNSSESVVFSKENKMCFYSDNNTGETHGIMGADLALLSPYSPEAFLTGEIYFSSHIQVILRQPFVNPGTGNTCFLENVIYPCCP